MVHEPDGDPTEAGGKSGENASDSSQNIGIWSSSELNPRIAFQVCFCWHGHYELCHVNDMDKRLLGCPDPTAFHFSHVYHRAGRLRRARCSAESDVESAVNYSYFIHAGP